MPRLIQINIAPDVRDKVTVVRVPLAQAEMYVQ
jgi:hypothetical protein